MLKAISSKESEHAVNLVLILKMATITYEINLVSQPLNESFLVEWGWLH